MYTLYASLKENPNMRTNVFLRCISTMSKPNEIFKIMGAYFHCFWQILDIVLNRISILFKKLINIIIFWCYGAMAEMGTISSCINKVKDESVGSNLLNTCVICHPKNMIRPLS